MNKIRNILRSIRIEEYLLLISSIFLFSFFFVLSPQLSWLEPFENGFKSIAIGVKYFSFAFIFIFFYILFKIYLYLTNWLSPLVEKKHFFKTAFLSLPNRLSDILPNSKKTLINLLIFLRPFFFTAVFFGLITLLLGLWAVELRGRLVDDWLMELDKSAFGSYPFLWDYGQISFFKYISPLSVYSYEILGLMMGIGWVVFYIAKHRAIFSGYIMAISLACVIGLPIWFFYPALTPINRYLDNVYNLEINPSIEKMISSYNPDRYVLRFQEEIRLEQGEIPDISAMPSMHAAWAIIVVYYFFRFNKRTIFLTLPWFFFSTFGTFYLAQHYFIDIVVALPVAIIAIWLAGVLAGAEKKYYLLNRTDIRENKFKSQIKKNLAKIPQGIKRL